MSEVQLILSKAAVERHHCFLENLSKFLALLCLRTVTGQTNQKLNASLVRLFSLTENGVATICWISKNGDFTFSPYANQKNLY